MVESSRVVLGENMKIFKNKLVLFVLAGLFITSCRVCTMDDDLEKFLQQQEREQQKKLATNFEVEKELEQLVFESDRDAITKKSIAEKNPKAKKLDEDFLKKLNEYYLPQLKKITHKEALEFLKGEYSSEKQVYESELKLINQERKVALLTLKAELDGIKSEHEERLGNYQKELEKYQQQDNSLQVAQYKKLIADEMKLFDTKKKLAMVKFKAMEQAEEQGFMGWVASKIGSYLNPWSYFSSEKSEEK